MMPVDCLTFSLALHWVLRPRSLFGLAWARIRYWLEASTNSLAMEESFGMAHEFLVQASDVNVTLASGDLVSLRVDVQHECLQGGVLWWGSYDAGSGIILDGHDTGTFARGENRLE